ncbi:hypothetical protein ACFLYI_01950 [Chloroflexota bacterium]
MSYKEIAYENELAIIAFKRSQVRNVLGYLAITIMKHLLPQVLQMRMMGQGC